MKTTRRPYAHLTIEQLTRQMVVGHRKMNRALGFRPIPTTAAGRKRERERLAKIKKRLAQEDVARQKKWLALPVDVRRSLLAVERLRREFFPLFGSKISQLR